MNAAMGLVDFLPVLLFLTAAVKLLRDLYHMMSKGAYALLAAGLLVIFMAGFYKALWKLLYGMGICDFSVLNTAFFPMQTTGFVLAGTGMIALLFCRQKSTACIAAAPVLFRGTMIFVAFTILGSAALWGSLAAIAAKMKKKKIMIIFLVSFVFMMAMGYLSSKDFTDPAMNWIGEGVNIIGMSLFLCGVTLLEKAGLETYDLK